MTVASADPTPLLSVRGLVKRFGTFTANDGIDLDLRGGEIHALVGENGAGKSTFVKMVYGVLQPTEGVMLWQGRTITLASPEEARALGIGMVFQHFSLFENLTVGENIALVLPKSAKLDSVADRIAEVADRYGIQLDPSRPVWTLSAGERQRIEIARCLLQDPKLLILDEPTSVLTPQEAEGLFGTLERLKREGRALLYISHRLDEVRRLCDRATILRHGKVVGTCDPSRETARSIAAMMVGSQIAEVRPASDRHEGAVRFATHRLSSPAADLHGTDLVAIDLAVHAGEVLGIAGVAGNGQSELFEVLSGERLAGSADAITIDGAPVGLEGVTARRRRHAAFVPEERNGHAAAPVFSLSDNVVLTRHSTGGVSNGGFILGAAARALAIRIGKVFDVRKSGADPMARTLSGGNLQKFVVGREILREPAVLIINQPTWGVDAAAGATIRQAIIDLAGRGAAVIVISQDLDELFEICDRIAVIHAGHLSTLRSAAGTTREEIGLLMGGLAASTETASTPTKGLHAH
ncbi:ABC transporter ATP-binding protein [Lichenihabitans psoromatis]|uniref:ABC transporter ATP-binding protein n=1 Tax=Lichenihabitans psoromatis TaxID=2528642 RepID=UPI001035E12B|nr:ABC transporter ATP-binding protein [Lichenihabitans psoromatis]